MAAIRHAVLNTMKLVPDKASLKTERKTPERRDRHLAIAITARRIFERLPRSPHL